MARQRLRRATDTSKSLLHWWFNTPHLMPQADGAMAEFQYYFAQREALETIVYLYEVVGAKDKFDLMRFDSSGAVSAGMFDESWRRYVVKMATGTGKTKVVLAWSFYHKLYEPESALARNFLVISPNIIVLDRIYKDFQGLRIFLRDDPVVPDNGIDGRNLRDDFQLTLHQQDNVRVTSSKVRLVRAGIVGHGLFIALARLCSVAAKRDRCGLPPPLSLIANEALRVPVATRWWKRQRHWNVV